MDAVVQEFQFRWVSRAVVALATILLVGMLGRVAQLQLAPSAALARELSPRVTERPQLSVRGDILDRRGRLLSVTRFGHRVFVDPTLLPSPPDEAILAIARTTGAKPELIGEKVLRSLEENERRALLRENPETKAEADARRAAAERVKVFLRTLGVSESEQGAEHEMAEAVPTDDPAEQIQFAKKPKGPIRFVPVTGFVSDDVAQAVRDLKIKGVGLEKRLVREYPGGEEVAPIIGRVGFDHEGQMGVELRKQKSLNGTPGEIGFVRDARGRPLWIEPGQVQPPTPGQDVRLSIDLELQRIAHEELMRGVEECDAAGGRLVMIDPATGELLAMLDIVREVPDAVPYPWVDAPKPRRRGDPPAPPEPDVLTPRQRYITIQPTRDEQGRLIPPRNRCVEDVYEPGSTFKCFVWSTITELGLAKPDEVFDTEGGRWRTSYGRAIEDVTKRRSMTWREVLANSSNIGMIKAGERLTPKQLHDVCVRFGFTRKTAVGLPGEAVGIVTPLSKWNRLTHTSVSYGYEVAVTPVQMVRAFAAFAREGELAGTLPQLRLSAAPRNDFPELPSDSAGVIYRVLPPDVAVLTRETMAAVTESMESRWAKPPEGGWQYVIFGKSGTAKIPLGKPPEGKKAPKGTRGYIDEQYNSSFIAGGPIEAPKLVVLVIIDDPGPSRIHSNPRSHYGAATAGPVVRRVLERSLAYLGAPPSRPAEVTKPSVPARPAAPGRQR